MLNRLHPIVHTLLVSAVAASAALAHAAIPARAKIDVTAYVIHADLDPATGRLTATAQVTFKPLQDLNLVTFGLNNALQVTAITDGTSAALISQRNVTDSTLQVTPTAILTRGTPVTWTFTYAGVPTVDTSPVDGILFARVADPVSVLLYPGRWFPIALPGLYTDRFTAQIAVTVPTGETVVGSGHTGTHPVANSATPRTEFDFDWTRPGFPGTIVAGRFLPPITAPGIPNIRVFLAEPAAPANAAVSTGPKLETKTAAKQAATELATEEAARQARGKQIAVTVAQEFEFMSSTFGNAESGRLEVVELPKDSVSASWGPEVVAVRPDRASTRLLANTVAHQWWGSMVSPTSLNDAWITNGMSRYAELLYVEDSSGKGAFQSAISDTEAGALAYDTDPLTTLGRLDPFSPQFQSMTLEKGAMVFHMLRWEMGDQVFLKFLRSLVTEYTDKSVRTTQVQSLAESTSNLQLTAFFSQWLDGTGAPQFTDNYSVFRLAKGEGFRTVGSVSQDLDLFSMPVELHIETEGKSEDRRVDLSGAESRYTITTFGRPRRITIDPDNWILKSTPDLAVKVAVLRGQQDLAQGDLNGAIAEYQKALDNNRGSSLANYRLAEVFMMQKNYQSAANSFRDALRGDLDPKWTEVWSHVNLGKIFDITGQRERAVNEYRQAIQTNDNTQGAINEARLLMAHPYKPVEDAGE